MSEGLRPQGVSLGDGPGGGKAPTPCTGVAAQPGPRGTAVPVWMYSPPAPRHRPPMCMPLRCPGAADVWRTSEEVQGHGHRGCRGKGSTGTRGASPAPAGGGGDGSSAVPAGAAIGMHCFTSATTVPTLSGTVTAGQYCRLCSNERSSLSHSYPSLVHDVACCKLY